jgi:hypothetical protein
LRILVIGESSARGEPYHPWLSVPQIVAWRLERILPGRHVSVDMWATGGATLAMMHERLAGLTYRPDVMIVYVGHNEFQTRYSWFREVSYYRDARQASWGIGPVALRSPWSRDWSPLCRLALELRDGQQVDIEPPRQVTRRPVDRPVCTLEETAAIVADFERRLVAIAAYCTKLGTLLVFIIPPGNDAGFDPSRSVLAASTPDCERAGFARALARARALECADPARALAAARELVAAHPEFAEAHYRLARLLERAGDWAGARRHYIAARERDALPLRCPEPIRQVFQAVAARHTDVVLVDGPRVLEAASPHGFLGDEFFHDAQHPNVAGYSVLAQDLLRQLRTRRAFGWTAEAPVPFVDAAACARHFQIDRARWQEICYREAGFFLATAYIRFDPKFRKVRAAAYTRAREILQAGGSPRTAGVPGWPFPPRGCLPHIPEARERHALTSVF